MSAIKRLALFLGAATLGLAIAALSGCGANSGNVAGNSAPAELTNVSYDPTRKLYAAYNELLEAHWKETTGNEIVVTQSHGGSGKQALEVANGLEADVVTLALEGDVLIAWENEAFLSLREYPGEYEIVIPSVSILCQPTVAVVDAAARKHGTEEAAAEYLNYTHER